MTAACTTNGKPPARKQLSDQLDRLDGIIDALAEGLNAAVADACREGARVTDLRNSQRNTDAPSCDRTTSSPARPRYDSATTPSR